MANETVIKDLVALDMYAWRKLVAEMAWTYRRLRAGVDYGVPECAANLFRSLPAEHVWAEIRKRVNLLRLKQRREAAIAARKARESRRRDYMRAYMQDYRAGIRKVV